MAGCLGDGDGDGGTGTPVGDIDVSSSAFEDGESMPTRYTANGADVSPPLSIGNVPADAAALAIVVDDPDAPNPPFTHWLCWAIPPDTTSVPDGIPRQERVSSLGDAVQGQNDMGDLGYRGPAPPADDGAHRYRFTVIALESSLGLEPGATRSAVDDAVAGNVLDRGRLTGTYDR